MIFDARNFFIWHRPEPPPFQRNQFGGNFGGLWFKNKAFIFWFVTRVLRPTPNAWTSTALCLSDSQRSECPTILSIARAAAFHPRGPTFIDLLWNNPRLSGSASEAPSMSDQSRPVEQQLQSQADSDRIHGY
jgi:hypothetical protein